LTSNLEVVILENLEVGHFKKDFLKVPLDKSLRKDYTSKTKSQRRLRK